MKPLPIPDSLNWVRATLENRQPTWAYTRRLLFDLPPPIQNRVIRSLQQGKIVEFEPSQLVVEALPMSRQDQQRRQHLFTFERQGFKLANFRAGMAFFYREVTDYYSMQAMSEWSFVPKPTIAVDSHNIPIFDQAGGLVDCFVPLRRGPQNFTLLTESDLTYFTNLQ